LPFAVGPALACGVVTVLSMEDFLIHYGLIAVLIGAALEGDVTLLLSGVVAHLGYVHFPVVVAAGSVGAMASDSACFLAGRWESIKVRQSRAFARASPVVERLTRRLGLWELLLARFVFGTRVASMVWWGIRGLAWTRFVVIDSIGCAAWALAMASLGYVFSGSAAMLIGDVKRVERWLAVASIVAVAAVLIGRNGLRRLARTPRAAIKT